MITARFTKANESLLGVEVSGHAEFAEYGLDIVCSAVTSALQLCLNGITEVAGQPATITEQQNRIICTLPQPVAAQSAQFLAALHLHYTLLAEQYPQNLQVILMEGTV